MSDLTATRIYRGDGVSILRPSGERITWRSWQMESREKCYHVRQYSNGTVAYAVNCETVPALPRTPLTAELMAVVRAEVDA